MTKPTMNSKPIRTMPRYLKDWLASLNTKQADDLWGWLDSNGSWAVDQMIAALPAAVTKQAPGDLEHKPLA